MTQGRVLIVNDQAEILEAKREYVKKIFGAEVTTAHSKQRALDLLEKQKEKGVNFFPYHAAYLDINTGEREALMPELADELLKRKVEVVLSTASKINSRMKQYAQDLGLEILNSLDSKAFRSDLEARLPRAIKAEKTFFEGRQSAERIN